VNREEELALHETGKEPRTLLRYLEQRRPVMHAFCYLCLVYVEIPVMIYSIVFPMITMNLFHVLVLVAMVVAAFNKDGYNRNIAVMLAFSLVIVLS
jgi:general stress protein CsbA